MSRLILFGFAEYSRDFSSLGGRENASSKSFLADTLANNTSSTRVRVSCVLNFNSVTNSERKSRNYRASFHGGRFELHKNICEILPKYIDFIRRLYYRREAVIKNTFKGFERFWQFFYAHLTHISSTCFNFCAITTPSIFPTLFFFFFTFYIGKQPIISFSLSA